MDKDKILSIESKLNSDPNGELKSISLINMTHPSLEEGLDKINLRVTNQGKFWTFMKTQPWSLKRKMTSMSMEVIS